MSTLPGDVTRLLRRLDGGDREAVARLLPLVYQELRELAAARLAGERPDHTLQPTALVHEAYVRLAEKSHPHWNDRGHFLRAAATVMRCILIDHARTRRRLKRSGGNGVAAPHNPFEGSFAALEERAVDLLALNDALEKLESIAPRQAELIELRFFGGLSNKAAAEVLGVSPRTADADWSMARAWLLREMGVGPSTGGGEGPGPQAGRPQRSV